jgi:hypothetical protein
MKLIRVILLASLLLASASCYLAEDAIENSPPSSPYPKFEYKLKDDFLQGRWFELASYGRKTVPCACSQYSFDESGDHLTITSLCLTKHGQEIRRSGSLSFTNSFRTQFEVQTPLRAYAKFVVDADLTDSNWMVLGDGDGEQISVLVRSLDITLEALKLESTVVGSLNLADFTASQCLYKQKLEHHFRILQVSGSEVSTV